MIQTAIDKITSLQPKEQNAVWCVGEHLKGFCRGNPHDADLIFHDLDIPEMSLEKAEAQIEAYAKSHRTGRNACVPPIVAEDILRRFYHLTPRGERSTSPILTAATKTDPQEPTKAVSVDLDEFL